MKRKTNLFYTSGPDSKFLTFSNYTDALTGNFLSVNTKLFPDKFICLKINNLNSSTKPTLIKYLVAYYENKLAMLRDNLVSSNTQIEHNICPLAYLLEALLSILIEDDQNGGYKLNIRDILTYEENLSINNYDNIKFIDKENRKVIIRSIPTINDSSLMFNDIITYIGNITEYDYNGIYADTICNINMSSYVEGTIETISNDENTYSYTYSTNNIDEYKYLYGWGNEDPILKNDNGINIYDNIHPVFDDVSTEGIGTYNYNTYLKRIIYNETDSKSIDYGKTLKFNIIIPLFSYINIDTESNTNILAPKIDSSTNKQYITLNNSENDNKAIYDVPLGIWMFADKEEDNFITLEIDKELNMYPTWSLLISSQFKPFPYSGKLNKDESSSESILHAYSTFAEVLSKMNNILDMFNNLNNNMQTLTNRIEMLEKKTGTANINELETYNIKQEMEDFKNTIYSYVRNLVWTTK